MLVFLHYGNALQKRAHAGLYVATAEPSGADRSGQNCGVGEWEPGLYTYLEYLRF